MVGRKWESKHDVTGKLKWKVKYVDSLGLLRSVWW